MATVNGTIAAGGDDVQIYGLDTDPIISDAGTTIWYGDWTSGHNLASLRFTLDAAIPDGATITSAVLNLYGSSNHDNHDTWILVTESGNAPQLADRDGRPTWASGSTTTYPTTEFGTGAIQIDTSAWTLVGWNNLTITSLIQHLVDTYDGLASSAHVTVWITGTDSHAAENGFFAYEEGSGIPTLTIAYTSGVTGLGPHSSPKIAMNW